jgi:YD repeat-containing protein
MQFQRSLQLASVVHHTHRNFGPFRGLGLNNIANSQRNVSRRGHAHHWLRSGRCPDQRSRRGGVRGTALTRYAYTYASGTNQAQLRQSMTDNDTSVSNVITNYGYSAQNQLLSATNTTTNTAQEYFYDPAGNRCNANTSSPPSAITSCASSTSTTTAPIN